jgi:pilus assembly protein CpaC
MALARIAAAALMTVAMSAAPSFGASGVNPAPPQESTLIKFTGDANGAPQSLVLPIGKGAVIELDKDVRDVFAANPAIVDAVVRTPRRIFIMGRGAGVTNLILLDTNGARLGTLEIQVGPDVQQLTDQIAREMPSSRVKAEALNGTIVLNGTVSSAADASQAQTMAARVAGSAERVVNGLRIQQATQVMIQVRVAEMSRTIAKQFGINVTAAVGQTGDGTPIFASTGNQFSLIGKALSAISGARIGAVSNDFDAAVDCQALGLLFDCNPAPTNAQGVVRAMEQLGLVHTLAEPNLTAVSGEVARFLVGGEFPVPISRDRDGNIVVEFKPFGVALQFTPVVLDKGHISLQVSTEVSELTNTGAFTLEGVGGLKGLTIPALAVRRAETTVELPSGGSLVIGGLLQQQTKQNIDGFPGLKDLPVLGGLFRSRDFQNSETELVVMITAYLVDPVTEARLARPDQGYVTPTDLETIVQGRLNSVYGNAPNSSARAPGNTVGYIID